MSSPLYENRRTWFKEHLRFFGVYLRHPRTVGAVAPSSRSLTRAMIKAAGPQLQRRRLVVELGVGTGVLTSHLGEVLSPRQDFFAIELNPVFAEKVRALLPGVTIHQDSAAHIERYLEAHSAPSADLFFSGIPWANLPEAVQCELLMALRDALAPGGKFITFAYTHSYFFPSSIRFRALLVEHFGGYEVSPVVWRNFPPAVVYTCSK